MNNNIFVFNQYYIDLLKKIKKACDKKDTIYKNIKENYATLDKTSDEYIKFVNDNISNEVWDDYLINEEWFDKYKDTNIYQNISLGKIVSLLDDICLCHHYCSVFYVFRNEMDEELLEKLVKLFQSASNEDIEKLENENYKKILLKLNELKKENIKSKTGIDMDSLKDTTIGKIAKEIIEDIDVSKIQKSLSEEKDIFKAIAKPDSGFGELFTNVSQKMASKISSGELSQENIINDAMKFASIIPGLFNKGNNNTNQQPNMMNMMNMMKNMMSQNNDDDGDIDDKNIDLNALKNLAAKLKSNKKGQKATFNENGIKKLAKMKQLKAKLNKRESS